MRNLKTPFHVALIVFGALALAAAAGAGTAKTSQPLFGPGEYRWYSDQEMTNLVGYSIYFCDNTREGPYGWITEWEEFIPYAC